MLTRTGVTLTLLCLLFTITAAIAAYLYFQLDRTAANLRSTQTELHTTGEDLAATRGLLRATEGDLATLATLAFLEAKLRTELTNAQAKYVALNETKDRIVAERDELVRKVGTIASLQDQQTALESEIADLQEQRQPLLLAPRTTDFACTGSMEPAITCLDTVTWNYNFTPDDLVVGATVRVPNRACDLAAEPSTFAHRVIDIRTVAGQPEYLTKGDANPEPDCWVPFHRINAYIIDIEKNVRPENAELRDHVNQARRDFDHASLIYQFNSTHYYWNLLH